MTDRYMIYLPADAPGRLIRCDDGDTCKLETLQQLVLPVNWKAMELYQYGYMSGIVGTAVLAAARGDELIGFAKPVCETICEEFGIDMEDGIWND